MKKNIIILSICAVALMFVSCGKENRISNLERLHVNFAGFNDENGSKLMFAADDYGAVVFDDGDYIYVNNTPFMITQDGDDWVANRMSGSGTLEGDAFYCVYFDEEFCKKNTWSASNHSYKITTGTSAGNANGLNTFNSGIVLEGMTADTVVTMRPMCAILRFETFSADEAANMYVGFDGEVAARSYSFIPGQVNAAPVVGAASFYSGINYSVSGITGNVTLSGHLLKATDRNSEALDETCVYHVVVPLTGTVNTSLYFMLYANGEYYYKKLDNVVLKPGNVYTYEW